MNYPNESSWKLVTAKEKNNDGAVVVQLNFHITDTLNNGHFSITDLFQIPVFRPSMYFAWNSNSQGVGRWAPAATHSIARSRGRLYRLGVSQTPTRGKNQLAQASVKSGTFRPRVIRSAVAPHRLGSYENVWLLTLTRYKLAWSGFPGTYPSQVFGLACPSREDEMS